MEGVDGGAGVGDGVAGGGAAAPAAAAAAGAEETIRVLVVDDSPIDRKIVERLLLTSGSMFEVIAVDGGKKALEVLGLNEVDDSHAANECAVDIILTDYCMPEMNGYELLKTVKEHKLQSSIPVVIMSSENDPQRISRCIATGAEDFILKPLQPVDVQHLRDYARPLSASATKTGSKRKLSVDVVTENNESETTKTASKRKLSVDVVTENNESERRPQPRLTGLAVA